MASELSDTQENPRMTPAVQWLLALNIGVVFLQLTLFTPEVLLGALALDPGAFPGRLWTLGSYMFVHAGLWHLSMNMLTLWMFGPRVENAWSTRSFTNFYLWCGLGGAIAHLMFGGGAGLVGASGAVSGVLLAYALRWPDEQVFLFGVVPMKSRWLIVWMIVINLAIGMSESTRIGWVAHLGGIAFGWLFLQASSLGGLARVRGLVSPLPEESEEMPRAVPRGRAPMRDRPREMDEVVARSNAVVLRETRAVQHLPRKETAKEHAARVNLVLDKISRQGMASLTSDELRLLEDMSKKLRDV